LNSRSVDGCDGATRRSTAEEWSWQTRGEWMWLRGWTWLDERHLR